MTRGCWSIAGNIVVMAGLLAFAPGGLRAEDGKFATDEVVRSEMASIRNLTVTNHSLVTHRRMPAVGARDFHARVKASVERIRAATTLTGAARTELDKIATEILSGAETVAAIKSTKPPIDGLIAIDGALVRYALRFDHPGWEPLR